MTVTRHDDESQAAIDALVWRLRNRDPESDDEGFATEYVAALRVRGWRPTEAKPVPTWREQTADRDAPHDPTPEYLAAKQAILDAAIAREATDDDFS